MSNKICTLIGSKVASDILGISSATLRLWRHNGNGPDYYEVGPHVKYKENDVLAYIEKKKVKPSKNN